MRAHKNHEHLTFPVRNWRGRFPFIGCLNLGSVLIAGPWGTRHRLGTSYRLRTASSKKQITSVSDFVVLIKPTVLAHLALVVPGHWSPFSEYSPATWTFLVEGGRNNGVGLALIQFSYKTLRAVLL